jgi:hypothetical protein
MLKGGKGKSVKKKKKEGVRELMDDRRVIAWF